MTAFPNKSTKPGATKSFSVKRIRPSESERIIDTVAVEEPLAIFLTYWNKDRQLTRDFAVTMRTPGNDAELAAGYLLGEGIIQQARDVIGIVPIGSSTGDELRLELARHVDFDAWQSARASVMNSACGICGKRLVGAHEFAAAASDNEPWVNREAISEIPDLLRSGQAGFDATGGLHAAALIDEHGGVELSYEDVGRHNALDKLLGRCLLDARTPLSRKLIAMSSRASYELVQKTVAAGGTVLATVGAPTSLAIEASQHWGVTLVSFVRDRRFNIYSGDWRVRLS